MQPSIGYRQPATVSLLALALGLAAGCGDSAVPTATPTEPPARGSIQVSVPTTGADLDPDGFVVAIDSTTRSVVGINGTIAMTGVPTGTHVVQLEGVAANCKASHTVEQVSVGPGDGGSPSIVFSVSCFTRSIPPALASTQLLFVRDGQIYRTRLDGTGLVAVGSGAYPAWSPDGRRIAFARGGDLYVMDVDGTNVQRVAAIPGSYVVSAPAWSPDGSRLAFGTDDGWGSANVVVVAVGGTTPLVLMPGGNPAWSPDGSRIAIDGNGVWTVAPDGSDRRALLPNSLGDLAWSPDGKRIAAAGFGGVTVVNADGSSPRQLTSIWSSRPAWSPDGQAIAFVDPRDRCGSCSPPVFYVTTDGRTIGLMLENGDSPSWHK